MQNRLALLLLLAACMQSVAFGATNDAKAEAARKKPLQRCDQLSDKAELECLQKARERILEARRKREGAAEEGKGKQKATAPAANAAPVKAQEKATPTDAKEKAAAKVEAKEAKAR